MNSWSSGCLLKLAIGFAGLSMTMSLLVEINQASASVNLSSSVCCSNVLLAEGVVGATTLAWHGGSRIDCLVAVHFAASFHVILFVVFLACHLANGSITSETHSEVRSAWMLSHWRTLTSLSVPSFHSGHAVGAHNHIQPSLLFGILYWPSVSML